MMFRLTILFLLLGASACEDDGALAPGATGEAHASAEVNGRIQAGDFDLEASAALVRDGKVKNGKEFQRALNRPGRSKIDLDKDGKRDPIQVVERRDDGKRALEIRAIPSSKRKRKPDEVAVPVAVVEFVPDGEQVNVSARYADGVIVVGAPVITFVVAVNVHVFCRWLFIVERPIFIGTVVVVHHYHGKHKHKHKHKKW